MKKPKPGPDPKNKSRPFGTKRKSCGVSRSGQWIAIVSEEIWGGLYFSRTGLAIHSSRDVTPEWIGSQIKKALETSEYCVAPEGPPFNPDDRIAMQAASSARDVAFSDEVAATYGYKNREAAWKKYDYLFISWFYETEPDIIIKASKSSAGGHHTAWPRNMNEGRVFHVPFTASDEEIGNTVLQAFAKCEGPGKSTQPVFP